MTAVDTVVPALEALGLSKRYFLLPATLIGDEVAPLAGDHPAPLHGDDPLSPA